MCSRVFLLVRGVTSSDSVSTVPKPIGTSISVTCVMIPTIMVTTNPRIPVIMSSMVIRTFSVHIPRQYRNSI